MNATRTKNKRIEKETLLARFNCGPVKLSGDHNAFYERHVTFDQVVPESQTSARDKFHVKPCLID